MHGLVMSFDVFIVTCLHPRNSKMIKVQHGWKAIDRENMWELSNHDVGILNHVLGLISTNRRKGSNQLPQFVAMSTKLPADGHRVCSYISVVPQQSTTNWF